MYNFLRVSLLATAAFVLAACGGGGGGSNSAPLPDKQHTYSVGGTISGLGSSTLVLSDTDSTDKTTEQLSITGDGAFAFKTPLPYGAVYIVSVSTPPNNLGCRVDNGTNPNNPLAATVTNVQITCSSNTYTVGGTVSGLAGTGLQLQNNGGDTVMVVPTASPAFTFPTPVMGGAYAVTVSHQPTSPTQTCTPTANASSGAPSGNITNVVITCATNAYAVRGNITGLSGSGLQLQLQVNGVTASITTTPTSFAAASPVLSGLTYAVSVIKQPSNPSQTCTVANGSGTVGNSDVTNIAISCSTNTYSIGGMVTGLGSNSTGVQLALSRNGTQVQTYTAMNSGAFTFSPLFNDLDGYSVAMTAPSNYTCTASNTSGTVMAGNVSTITINCTEHTYAVSVTVSGLGANNAGLVLADTYSTPGNTSTAESLPITGDGSYNFVTKLPTSSTYAVTVFMPHPDYNCTITSGSGSVGTAPATINVDCTAHTYTVSASVTGLVGSGLVITNNGTDNLPINSNDTFTFANKLKNTDAYAVTVTSQPTSPTQTCTVTNGSGTVARANVPPITITCSTLTYTVGGNVTGLAGSGLVLQNNGGDNLSIGTDGTFVFHTAVANGASYNVTVATQPTPAQLCSVTNGSGSVVNALINTVTITCTSNFGHFAYVSNSSTSTPAGPGIWQYAMDPSTGILTPMSTATIGTAPVGTLAIHPSNKFAYGIEPILSGIPQGIAEYSIATTSGALANASSLSMLVQSEIAMDLTGHYAYVPGVIYGLLVINGSEYSVPSNVIFGLSIDSTTGQFTKVSTLNLGFTGILGVGIAPSGQLLYVLQSLGSAYIEEYSLSNGVLTDKGVAVSNAAGATGLTIHPNGLHMYLVGMTANSITQYDIDATGALTLVQSPVAAGTAPGAITIDPSGRFAYALSSTDHSIAQFSIDPSTGAPIAMTTPTIATGPSPTSMAIESAGRYAYVTCSGDSTIIQYTLGPTGALTRTNTTITAPMGTPSSIAIAGPSQ